MNEWGESEALLGCAPTISRMPTRYERELRRPRGRLLGAVLGLVLVMWSLALWQGL